MPATTSIRLAALDVISSLAYQSPEIDRIVMEIYSENMDDGLLRLRTVEVMPNNNPEVGVQMMREYIAEEKRVDLAFRLIGARELLERGYMVDWDIIDQGLASQDKNIRSNAGFIKKDYDQLHSPGYTPPPPVKPSLRHAARTPGRNPTQPRRQQMKVRPEGNPNHRQPASRQGRDRLRPGSPPRPKPSGMPIHGRPFFYSLESQPLAGRFSSAGNERRSSALALLRNQLPLRDG